MTQLTETTVNIATVNGSKSVTAYTLNPPMGLAITEVPYKDGIGYSITHIASGRTLFPNPCPNKQTAIRVLKWLAKASTKISLDWTATTENLDMETAKEIAKTAEHRFPFLVYEEVNVD